MTTTDSAHVTPTAPVVAPPAEHLEARSRAAVRAERRAWLVLWLAFATCCALVFSTAKFVIDFVNTAQIDQSAVVTARQGNVIFIPPGGAEKTVLERTELGVGTVLSLDRASVSSAELQLFDKSQVRIQPGASLELERMEVGRFIKQQALVLNQTAGVVQYTSVGQVDVSVPGGVVRLGSHSDATVWVDDTGQTRLLMYDGEARLDAGGQSLVVPKDKRGHIVDGRLRGVFDRPETVTIPNADFARRGEGWQVIDQPSNPLLDVNGQRFWVDGPDVEGRQLAAMRVLRERSRGEHGETGLTSKLNVDVSGYRHLWLQAFVRVDYASLSGGGYLGSEYPMMLRVQYEGPIENSQPDWQVGFYISNPENRPTPTGRAVQWPAGEWNLYRIDLMNTDPAKVPYRLRELAVMGQGHDYDARVAGIELVGE